MKAKKTTHALPPDLRIDDPHNWDFNDFLQGLPPEESFACCIWEFARESASFRDTLRMLGSLNQNEPMWSGIRKLLLQHGESEQSAGERIMKLSDYGLVHLTIPIGYSLAKPWQSLDDDQRRMCVNMIQRWGKSEKPACMVWNHPDVLGELCTLHAKPSLVQMLGEVPSLVQNGVEYLVLRIDWGRYNEREIKRAFNKWVDKHRPPSLRKPRGRPRNSIDPAAALRCLAIMRILRSHTLHDLAYKFEKVNTLKPQRNHAKALEIFHQLFPKLKDELPLSWRKLDK